MSSSSEKARPYTPGLVRAWLEDTPQATWRQVHGTLVFVDISGFTQLSERLSRSGKVGGEELTDAIDTCFSALLEVASQAGGSLLKFGGDALLLLFAGEDHVDRACSAAVGMRAALRNVGNLQTSAGQITLRMSVGVHTGAAYVFLVGGSHRELVIAGLTASAVVSAEGWADTDEIVVSAATATHLGTAHLGPPKGEGFLLHRAPEDASPFERSERSSSPPSGVQQAESTAEDLLSTVPLALRAHVLADQHDAEHRRVTIAFLRFQGLDRRLTADGPDVVADLLDSLIRRVQQAVEARGITFLGTDIDTDGGKILLTAGAPSSGGNDEELMLLALRDITEPEPPIPLRIGVHVGHVFAGDIGPESRRTYTVMGDAVNLAARVMGRAMPGQIVATSPVLDASWTTFRTIRLSPFQVKGKSEAVIASTVGPSLGTRQERGDGLELPFVGRRCELAIFDEALRQAGAGTGSLIELVGEGGIGKSRLLQAVRQRATDAEVHTVTGELHRVATPYGTLRKLLRRLLRIPVDASAPVAAEQLRAALASDLPELLPWAPLLAIAFGTELPATAATANLDERFVRDRLHAALLTLLTWRWDRPVLLTIEDAHWLDEASTDAIHAVAVELAARPWVVATTRREPDPDIPTQAPRTTVVVEPLDGDAAIALAGAATDSEPLPSHDLRALIERSGGNPMFLQELVVAARELGGVEALPDTVGSLVAARIDRLPPAQRSVLREVSVLGYSFPRELAAAVLTGRDPGQLDQLAEFLDTEGGITRFRHAIIREVAYEGLPYRRRRRLHEAAGDTIAARGTEQPELLSFHYSLAGRHADAWRTSCLAGDNAAAVFANLDAARFYERALGAARRLDDLEPASVARVSEALGDARQRLGDASRAGEAYRSAARTLRSEAVSWARVRLKQARVQAHLKRYSQALATITRTLRHLEDRDDGPARSQRAQLMVWYGHFRLDQGRHADALRWSEAAIEEAEASGDRDALGHAYRLLDWAHVYRGNPEQAVYSQRALEMYEHLGDLQNLANVHNNLGGIAYWLGNWEQALEHYARANELDERTGDVLGAALGRNNLAEILADQGRWEEAVELFRDTDRVVRAAHFPSAIAFVRSNLGRTLGRLGHHDEALEMLREARDTARDVGAATQVLEAEARIAEVHVLRARPTDAMEVIDGALRRADTGEGIAAQEPMLHRVRGYALLQLGRYDEARAALEQSLQGARARDADYEQALTLQALVDVDIAESGEADQELAAASRATLEELGIERLPRPPLQVSAI